MPFLVTIELPSGSVDATVHPGCQMRLVLIAPSKLAHVRKPVAPLHKRKVRWKAAQLAVHSDALGAERYDAVRDQSQVNIHLCQRARGTIARLHRDRQGCFR
jgi:hypothetical protein